MNDSLKSILQQIVQTLEVQAAGLVVLSEDVLAIKPKSAADQRDALQLAIRQNATAYENLRKKIAAL
jgi:hypothetical protein